jgi:Domain of unknown function (DUF4249)
MISFLKNIVLTIALVAVFIGAVWILQSCSMTVTGVELAHDEKIVVYASLIAGESVKNIQITHTVPPLDTFNVERSRIENAQGSVTVDGVSYALRLQPRVIPVTRMDSINYDQANQPSLYEAVGLTAQSGKTYTLQVSWNNKQATATTRVPEPPSLATQAPLVVWRPEPFRYVQARPRTFPATGIVPSILASVAVPVMARNGEAYRIEMFVARDTMTQRSTTSQITLNATNLVNASAGMPLTLKSETRFFVAGDSIFKPTIFMLSTRTTVSVINVIAHDDALLNFITTQARNSATGSPFGNSGQNPLWNVTGAGIGLFIGQSRSLQLTVRP